MLTLALLLPNATLWIRASRAESLGKPDGPKRASACFKVVIRVALPGADRVPLLSAFRLDVAGIRRLVLTGEASGVLEASLSVAPLPVRPDRAKFNVARFARLSVPVISCSQQAVCVRSTARRRCARMLSNLKGWGQGQTHLQGR